ncbi:MULTISPECIES: hypothetical protein [Alcaligenes]|jgi:hypothetical protein|uniref:Uncharacterized protein n=2 Tax=Alcaligenes TaxID=507 RepID=A0A3G2HVT7_9BURK|nr:MULTISPECIES: hypothetical protein [Alcaligenes]ASR89958.1 hypothetical protein AFA_11145 [Alcaligenes faecalis]AYN21175.1 hypothetical protein D3M96_11955 [Alcaligenes aquatilis]MCC9162309.1 hypothetical protein [Alcaligenes sp. MMA]MCH4225731.1 hypothetical protein [Alcaligenes faecalis]QXR34485.1 hypothetical protein EGK70_011375 [Alcaligenes aquatilis]
MSLLTRPSRILKASLLSLGLLSPAAWAQTPSQDYQRDIQRCEQFTGEQRTTCRREAGAALQAARHHKLDKRDHNMDANRQARCHRLPADRQQDCLKAMTGQDTTVRGSVEGGGILRETTTVMPAP